MNTRMLLHVGAHRTGTTTFQAFLSQNQDTFSKSGINILVPSDIRSQQLQGLDLGRQRCIVSEENFLGTMEHNISQSALYPNAQDNIARVVETLKIIDTAVISIRNIREWWVSAVAFCLSRNGLGQVNEQLLDRIAQSERSWKHVVEDVISASSGAKVVVRDFSWKTDNPKQLLLKATGWAELKDMTLARKKHNAQPTIGVLARKASEKRLGWVVDRIHQFDSFELFDSSQTQVINDRYFRDLEFLRSCSEVEFLCEPQSTPRTDGNKREHTVSSQKISSEPPKSSKICFLHIGKTGGTFIKSAIGSRSGSLGSNLVLGGHDLTIFNSLEKYGVKRKVAFFFRSPDERFVSGFMSRLRQGRPQYNVPWQTAEAVAFSYFETANDLAEALFCGNDRLESAARFAMNNIFHLKLNYRHFLGSSDTLLAEFNRGNIILCCETARIDQNINLIKTRLGARFQSKEYFEKNGHQPATQKALSEKGLRNLESFWKSEYKIYSTCVHIASELGF